HRPDRCSLRRSIRWRRISLRRMSISSSSFGNGTPRELPQADQTQPGNFQVTPLMIDNVLYLSTPFNRVVALNAETGQELWAFDPKAYQDGQPPNGTGFVHRGVAAWRDTANGNKLRFLINSRYSLIRLDASIGVP